MANIGIDAKRAFRNFSGLGNYSRALISGLSRFYRYDRYFLYTPDYKGEGKWLDFSRRENIRIRTPRGIYSVLPSPLWRSRGIVHEIRKDKIDLFHGLSGELPDGNFPAPKVVTMHDVIFLRYPEYYKAIDRRIYEKKFRQACRDADKIIAISRQTADDLIRFLEADPKKIEIIYQGCDKQFYNPVGEEEMKRVKAKYGLPDRFIVNVGTIETRKNLASVVKAMSAVPAEIHLVALGRATPYIGSVMAAAREAGVEQRVHLIHDASFQDFPAIYRQALALTYVSVFEGFGIPVLEGLTAGIPVITSNLSSMPEAGGDAALYVNPHDPQEIARSINLILSSPTLISSLIEKGKNHAARFREDIVARNVHDIYASLLP